MRKKLAAALFAGLVALGGLGAVACDDEGGEDVEELDRDVEDDEKD
jgi:hypothetical protein